MTVFDEGPGGGPPRDPGDHDPVKALIWTVLCLLWVGLILTLILAGMAL